MADSTQEDSLINLQTRLNNNVEVSRQKCIGCQACVNLCPTRALAFNKETKKAELVRPYECMHCSHCFAICPVGAITLFEKQPENEQFEGALDTVLGAIKFRRSIRRFTPQKLGNQFIYDLINVTKFCPSGMNKRPVKFIVLSRQILNRLAKFIAETCDSEFPGILKLQQKFDVIFRSAQHVIVAYTDVDAVWGQQDAAIALETIDLFCESKGVGSCWIGFLTKACAISEDTKKLLGLDENAKVQSCLGIGVPAFKFKRSVARQDATIEWRD